MNYPKAFQSSSKNKIALLLVSVMFLFVLTIPSYPGKSCEKVDTLKTETKNIESVDLQAQCDKNKTKEECKKFNMMSLNLVYYLMNKYICPKIDKK